MFHGTFDTIYKGEDALHRKYPKKKIWSQIASSKTLVGAERQARKYGFKSNFHIIKSTSTGKFYVYI